MKTIEERIETIMSEEIGNLDHPSFDLKYEIEAALKRIATEQKAIDDANLAEAKRQRDAYYDELLKLRRQKVEIIDKACNVFCHTGCPHKTDSFNCLNTKCESWKIFKRMVQE